MADDNQEEGMVVRRLTKRADFLRVRHGSRVSTKAFLLQMASRENGGADDVRVGYTVTKKTGNAVERNRIKRRMREAVRHVAQHCQRRDIAGHDAVLVARRAALTIPFEKLRNDICRSLDRLGAKGPKPNGKRG